MTIYTYLLLERMSRLPITLLIFALLLAPTFVLVDAILMTEDNPSKQIISSVSEDPTICNYVEACNMISKAGNADYFHRFRRIQSYTTVVEPTDLWVAEAYIKYIAQNCSWILANGSIFSKVMQIDAYGKPYMHDFITNTQIPIRASALALRFGAFIGKISKKVISQEFSTKKISSVLEIGGGFGGFAVIATDIFKFDSYTIVDIPEALNVQKRFLSHFPHIASKMKYVDGKKIHQAVMDPNQEVAPTAYDLCISTYAFSELILEYRETYFEIFVKNCKYGFFIDNGGCFEHLKLAHSSLGVAAMAKRLESHGLIETEIVDEVPSSSKDLNCNNYEMYFWPKKRGANFKRKKSSPYNMLGLRRGDRLQLADIHAAFEQRLVELKDAVSLLTHEHRLQMYDRYFFENLGDAGLACGQACFKEGKEDCACAPKLRKMQQKWQASEIDRPQLIFWADNVFSQNGEDGIIQKIFDIIGTGADGNRSPRAIEFGAWDGFYLSNTAALWSQDNSSDGNAWSAILIEADKIKYKKLKENLLDKGYSSARVLPLLGMVGTGNIAETEDDSPSKSSRSVGQSLEKILEREGIVFDGKENEFALLSIDVDSHDLQILNTLRKLRPRVIICEYNPTLPPSVILHQKNEIEDGPKAFGGNHGMGASMGAIWGAAKRQRYTPVASTVTNLILVRDDLVTPILDLGFEVSFDALRTSNEHLLMYLATDFNGSPLIVTSNNYGAPYGVRKKPLDAKLIDSNSHTLSFPEMTNQVFWDVDLKNLICDD
jgi:hypothetical protein